MKKSSLRRALNRILGIIARFLPGATTVRPFLHKLRGVRITGRVFIGDDVYLENEYPEGIELREGAQIGLRSILIAHTRGLGRIVVGKDAFLGANCVITAAPGLTLTIGDGAVITASSVVASDVPPGTLLGIEKAKPLGTVAVPLTMNTSYDAFLAGLTPLAGLAQNGVLPPGTVDLSVLSNERNSICGAIQDQPCQGAAANVVTRPSEEPIRQLPVADHERARELIGFALGIKSSELSRETSVDSCMAWDSLGQIAIATALFDRYGITVDNRQAYRLRTLEDIENVIAENSRATSDGGVRALARAIAKSVEKSPERIGIDSLLGDVEMLPLIDRGEATRVLTNCFLEEPATIPSPRSLNVIIASNFTAQPLATTMKVWGRAFGLELNCEFAGFNQIVQVLLADHGPFSANEAGVNVVLVDPTDRAFHSAEGAFHATEEILGAIEAWRSRQPQAGRLLVGTLPPLASAFATIDREQYEVLRHQWRTRLGTMPGVQLIDFARVVEEIGIATAYSSEGEVLSRMPYSSSLYQALAIRMVRQILAGRRSPAKVIAVDCDNTLWGGVVGEVGLAGIKLGSDGGGRGFHLFQRYLKNLKERGLLLLIVSLNEEADVRNVFDNHPEMVLRTDDIAAWRVNWKHKSDNLQELADELNLGLDSFVFLDDDVAVRMEVSMRLPAVHVVPLPLHASRYCETLERLWLFDGAHTTEADLKRTRMMQEENGRQRQRQAAASLEDYLAGLDLEVEIREAVENEWQRIAQLTQRTNQFNLSLKRRSLEEVRSLAKDCSVLIVKACDRFGDYGLVGVGVIRNVESNVCEIDTLLMSCRVLGRGVEDAFLFAIAKASSAQGASLLRAPFVQGPRNQLLKDFLIRTGFREASRNDWELDITKVPPPRNHIRWVNQELPVM